MQLTSRHFQTLKYSFANVSAGELDDASCTMFITNTLKSEVGIEGVSSSLNLCTMHGCEVVPASRVHGLVVERPDRCAKVKLPKAEIQFHRDSRHVASSEEN